MTIERLRFVVRTCESSVDPGPPPEARQIILRAEARSGRGGSDARGPERHGILRPGTLATAIMLLAFAALATHQRRVPPGAYSIAVEEFTTDSGESTTVRLNDGSLIRLGPESRLRVGPGGPGRQVSLEGRAFFAIAPDTSRPFRVVLPAGSARVLGTRFHIEADLSNTRLVVLEGSVALTSAGREVHVRQDQMTEFKAGEPGPVRAAPGLASLSAVWMGDLLMFQDTPLRRVASEIQQVYGVPVRIDDPALTERTLSMWFSRRTLEEVLTVVCTVIEATCRMDDGLVTIGLPETRH